MRLRTTVLAAAAVLAAMTAGAQWPGVDDETDEWGQLAAILQQLAAGYSPANRADAGATGAKFRCSVFGNFSFQGVLRYGRSDARIEQMIDDIVKASGLKKNFQVVSSPDVPNAAAWVEGDRRMIGYNPYFLDDIVSRTGTHWAVRSIMAHEVGHHLQGHTLQRSGSRPAIELEADNYSGHIVRWLNGTLDDAQVAMKALAPPRGSATHPGQYRRLNAIAEGWHQAAERRGTGTGQPSTSPSPLPRPNPSPLPRPNPWPLPRPNPGPTPQVATACCNVVSGQIVPICPMTAAILPVGASCACYNALGVPFFAGVGCR